MARPTKYTPETVKLVTDALTAGMPRKGASEYAGIDENTLGRWMHRYADFADAVIRAEAQCEFRATLTIRAAFNDGDWKAAAFWLERRRNKDWGRQDRVEIINTVRQLAQAEGLSEEEITAAVVEAESYLKGLRGGARG